MTFEIKTSGSGSKDVSVGGRSFHYQKGYKQAVDLLYENMLAGNSDELIYPYCFVSRQYLELKLKGCIEAIDFHEHNQISAKKKPNHWLRELWNELKDKMMNNYNVNIDSYKEFESLKRFILKWDEIDKKSDKFRFAKTITGEPSFSWLETLDVLEYQKLFNDASGLLTRIEDELDRILDLENDLNAEANINNAQ
jgi:hypothetical protein